MTARSGTRAASRTVSIGRLHVGAGHPLVLFAGPCVIESEAHALRMAERLVKIASAARIPLVFKASYDKANRSSISSYRGPGLVGGGFKLCSERSKIAFLWRIPLLTDIHEPEHAAGCSRSLRRLARCLRFFRGRPILLLAAGRTERVVNLKKEGNSCRPGRWPTR